MEKYYLKVILIVALLLSLSSNVFSQKFGPNPFGEKYLAKDVNALKMVKIIDLVNFHPIKRTNDLKHFKSVILQLPDELYDQTNRDTWYLCSYKHEENFQIYNMHYKPVSKSLYDDNCKLLIALMIFDGTINQPK